MAGNIAEWATRNMTYKVAQRKKEQSDIFNTVSTCTLWCVYIYIIFTSMISTYIYIYIVWYKYQVNSLYVNIHMSHVRMLNPRLIRCYFFMNLLLICWESQHLVDGHSSGRQVGTVKTPQFTRCLPTSVYILYINIYVCCINCKIGLPARVWRILSPLLPSYVWCNCSLHQLIKIPTLPPQPEIFHRHHGRTVLSRSSKGL